RPIGQALAKDDAHEAARRLQRIVARDAARLDRSGLIRAAVESVAEGFVDGFLAPLFWFGAAGAAAAATGANSPQVWAVGAVLAFRSVNTLDSMVGYRNKRYLRFGRASARLDDAANFIPARLSIPVLWLAAEILRLPAGRGWQTALRDRLKHASPNSAHAESFVAGVLGIRLGGPTVYSYGTVSKPWLGKGEGEPRIRDIESACALVLVAGVVAVLVTALLLTTLG
ncbi:MAG: CobD/CbiB family cobalamin biosynthesis protein, partial [Verrucomicrobiota bacterium]